MRAIDFLLLVITYSFLSCDQARLIEVVIAEEASVTELLTAADLKSDLLKATDYEVEIVSEGQEMKGGIKIFMGTTGSNGVLKAKLEKAEQVFTDSEPGSRGGLWYKVQDEQSILLCGSDLQGMQYAVYDYAKMVLGIDPLHYWSGHGVEKISVSALFHFDNKRITPPVVDHLVYFENDVDELANLKPPLLEYDWESYTQMIHALVRMRYNAIHLFDMLGRPEFFLRKSYQEIRPDYEVRLDYVEKMIDYAHDMGMKVQIDMSLGYQIKSLPSKYADCWSLHKEKWIELWHYYLRNTPIGKADIFSLRPRNQIWDWEYKSTCGEDKITVFNEVYLTLDSVLQSHSPDAIKVVVCYADAMEMFENGFSPPGDWIIAWSDDGYADFEYLPESTRGYDFGTYMHAGFWKNHSVQNPLVERIDSSMHLMFEKYGATKYCEVNGQQFRPFLLNLEAYSEVCRDPLAFTGHGFYQQWVHRYFPDSVTEEALTLMRSWETSTPGSGGYVQNLWEIKEAIAYLTMLPLQQPGKSEVASTAERVEDDLSDARDRFFLIKGVHFKALQLLPKMEGSSFFYDQIFLPLQLYLDLLTFEQVLHEIFRIKRKYEQIESINLKQQARVLLKRARYQLQVVYVNLEDGHNPQWEGWYDVGKRRPNNGFPKETDLDAIELAIESKW